MPAGWKVVKIKRLFFEHVEKRGDREIELLSFSRTKGLVPYSSLNEKEGSAEDLSDYKVIVPGQLLENRLQAWSGMFVAADITGCVSPDYSVFNASPLANVKFYQYLFRSPCSVQQFANASRGVGAGFNRLYTPQFGAIETLLPSPDEQRQIVAYLDEKTAKVDRLIQLKEREIELLNEKKQAMISKVVTGKFAVVGSNTEVQRHRDGRATSMKSPPVELRPRRSDELVDSGVDWIGQVPRNWDLVPLKKLGRVLNGREIGVEIDKFDPKAIPVYGSGGVFKYTDTASYNGNAVLFGRKGTLGKPLLVSGEFAVVDTMYLSYYDESVVDVGYVYNVLKIFDWNPYITHTAIPSLVANDMFCKKIPVPPLPEQREIVAYLDGATAKIDAAVAAIEKSIGLLKERWTRLVSDAVTGRIDLRKEVA